MTDLNAFGSGARFHHIGLVVGSIDEVNPALNTFLDPIQKVKLAFVSLNGAPLELLEPMGEDSPLARSLETGNKLVHVCFEVPDLEQAIAEGRRHGFHRIRSPVPAVAFGNREIVWVFSRTYGLVELLRAELQASDPDSSSAS